MKTYRWILNAAKIFSLFSSEQNENTNAANTRQNDDTPTTSNRAQRSPNKFRKLRDDLQQQSKKRQRKRKSLHQKPSGQIATQKLLRSIRRRHQEHSSTTTTTPHQKRSPTERRRRLNLLKTTNKKLSKQQQPNKSETTLEEGELVSENEDNANKPTETAVDDEEDCICIEQHIEQITIDDDDTPSISATTSDAPTVKNLLESIEERSKLRTPSRKVTVTYGSAPSTPSYAAIAASAEHKSQPQNIVTSTPADKSNKADSINIEPPPFFVDTSSVPWFETINSEDTFTNYTRGCSTLREHSTKKRRSVRIKKRFNSDSDVIVLDDTSVADVTIVPTPPATSSTNNFKKRKSNQMDDDDDSVVFVSESNPNKLPTYIPLEDDNVPNPVKVVRNPFIPKRYKPMNPLFTLSEHKQLEKYNDNAYNPHANDTYDGEKSPKRMVIVDGSNVAYSHALNKEFSVKGLKICLDYFEKIGHEVKAVVPQHRLQRHKSTDPEELERLHGAGKIVFTPCKNLPGKSSTSYDDRFVLQLACELDAAVVSNDNYRDLFNENAAFKKIIENRVIGYSWCNDMFIVPKDPYGKWGPTLHTILNRA